MIFLPHARRSLLALAAALLFAGTLRAQAPEPLVSFDITTLARGGGRVADEQIARLFQAGESFGIPIGADLAAYHEEAGVGRYFAVDVSVVVTHPGGDLDARPSDVLLRDPKSGLVRVFEGSAFGVPAGIGIDALTRRDGFLVLSFDASFDASGLLVADEDLVRVDGGLQMELDGSAAGVPRALDLDAAHWDAASQQWFLSFDITGTVGGVTLGPGGLVSYSPSAGIWELQAEGYHLGAPEGGNLDALSFRQGPLFADGFESGDVSAW